MINIITCKTNLKTLDVIHNQALRICTGAYKTSPIESLYVTAGEKSLSLIRESLSIRFYLKSMSFINSSSYNILTNFNMLQFYLAKPKYPRPLHIRLKDSLEESTLNNVSIFKCHMFRIPPWIMPEVKVCKLQG